MLESVNQNNEQYIDFYKTEKSASDINKAYDLITRFEIIDKLKINSGNLIKINNVVLNRIKIIIKKYFNFKNKYFNNLNKIIKNNAKALNIDNLLYISYIFDVI